MGVTWIDQQTAPKVPRTLAAIGTSIFLSSTWEMAEKRKREGYIWLSAFEIEEEVFFVVVALELTNDVDGIVRWSDT